MNHDMDLTKGSISKLIMRLAIPISIGFFFNTMFNVVDTYFAGLLNTQALAALSLSFPIFFIIISLASGVSTGATSLIANSLGAKDEDKAIKYTTQSISFAVLVAVLSSILMYFIAPSLFRLLGAKGEYLDMALMYMNPIIFGALFFFLTFTINAILSAQGDTRPFRNFLIIGFFLNIILDPLLMFGYWIVPSLGIAGIAIATILVELFGVIYLFFRFSKTELFCSDCLKHIKPDLEIYKEIAQQGFPAALNMMTVALGAFIITYFIKGFGESAVAAYGVALRVEQIALLPMIGLTTAALAIVGQNNGAGKIRRMKETIIKSLKYGYSIIGIAVIFMFIFARPLVSIFSSDPEVISIGVAYLKIATFISLGYVTLYIITSALQGMKRPMFALYIGAYRQLAAPLIIFSLLIYFFHFGIISIWWGIFGLVWSSAVIALLYFRYIFSKKSSKIKART